MSRISKTSFWLLLAALTFGFATQTLAQSASRIEGGINYSYVRSNAPPGGCGCFSLNGGGGSFAYYLSPSFSFAAEINSVHTSDIGNSGRDLTLTSYVFGPRYHWRNRTRVTPFAQVLLGGAHASGSLVSRTVSQSASSDAFATQIGGGLDIPINQRLVLRPVEANYYLTRFDNGTNNHQNNLQLAAGIVLRFGGR